MWHGRHVLFTLCLVLARVDGTLVNPKSLLACAAWKKGRWRARQNVYRLVCCKWMRAFFSRHRLNLGRWAD
ncbi:hypothetical protein F5Y14DRAFT_422248 [Nemania sp. NC0429]|nr:hypothetical protein F5Y14DRAFT_422248 [Nemania sp. NC0429]